MAALFPRWTNTAYRSALVLLLTSVPALLISLMIYVRTPWNTGEYRSVDQPVEFDHRHHVLDDEISCLYCHRGAEVSAVAGVPSTDICMGCHAQIYNDSPLLEPVRRSYFAGIPIPWNRVHDTPDVTYFNHAVHVQRGVGCVSCHGRVDQMPRVYQVASLSMGWCLDCHGHPQAVDSPVSLEPTPPDHDVLFGSFPSPAPTSAGPRALTALTTCTACHR